MKTIKTIISALLIAAGMTVQAQQVMTVKTNNSNDKFQLTSRLVLDLTKQKPVVRTNSKSIVYKAGESMLMYLMPTTNDTYQLVDGITSFYNPEDMFFKKITYTRQFQNYDWQLLYLPLQLQYEEWSDKCDIARINDVNQYDTDMDGRVDVTELEVILLRNGYTEPNTPYVIRSHRTGTMTIVQNGATLYASEETEKTVSNWNTDFTIHGTYSAIPAANVPTGTYYSMESNSLGMGTANGKIDALRWYVTVTDRETGTSNIQKIRIREFSSDPDAIEDIHSDDEGTDLIYDISGRRVSRPAKGIYIQNGKKIAVK